MLGIVLIFYLLLLLIFVLGIMVVAYHLLTFQLNHILARFMVTLLLVGGIIFLGLNLYFFSQINWQEVLFI